MKIVPLTATEVLIDVKKNFITYKTDVESHAGILVLSDEAAEHGMLIVNQIHNGGKVSVRMKPFMVPARKYEAGDVIANLIVLE